MNESKIAVRYSKALFELAKEESSLEMVIKDMEFLFSISKLPEVKVLLESPVIKSLDKKRIFRELLESRVNKLTLTFLDLIIKNKREIYIEDISRRFIDDYKKDKGIKTAVLTSTVLIDENLKNKINQLVKDIFNCDIKMEEKINRNIIGGFILTVEDKQFDGSISTKLKKIKHELLNISLENKN